MVSFAGNRVSQSVSQSVSKVGIPYIYIALLGQLKQFKSFGFHARESQLWGRGGGVGPNTEVYREHKGKDEDGRV